MRTLPATSSIRRTRTPFRANLIDIAMADGSLAGAEKRLLENYVEKLQIGADVVSAMVDVIGLKNAVRTI